MKRLAPALAIVFFCLVLSGCQTTIRWEVLGDAPDPREKVPSWLTVERDPRCVWAGHCDYRHHFVFQNNSDEVAYIVYKDSVVEFGGRSYRALPASHLRVLKDLTVADYPIAPRGSADVWFYAADFAAGTPRDADLIFRIALRRADDAKTGFAVIYADSKVPKGEKLGEVATKQKGFCNKPSIEKNVDLGKVRAAAREQYGDRTSQVAFVGCD